MSSDLGARASRPPSMENAGGTPALTGSDADAVEPLAAAEAAVASVDATGVFACRAGCGACCIAPSITTPIPGMPHGKRAGERCVQLLADFRCALFGRPERPAFCATLRPTQEMCGSSREEALATLDRLEIATRP